MYAIPHRAHESVSAASFDWQPAHPIRMVAEEPRRSFFAPTAVDCFAHACLKPANAVEVDMENTPGRSTMPQCLTGREGVRGVHRVWRTWYKHAQK